SVIIGSISRSNSHSTKTTSSNMVDLSIRMAIRATARTLFLVCVLQLLLTPVSGIKKKGDSEACNERSHCIRMEKCPDSKTKSCGERKVCCKQDNHNGKVY
ncbi:unnamed protein product, partial [Meganyctiphanes norvegica]